MYRRKHGQLGVLLVHPGGPFWKNKDAGAWTIPKGELDDHEEPLATAIREFHEETGLTPQPPYIQLPSITQKAGKVVHAWAFEGDCDPALIKSNTYEVQWPPKSGKWITCPEVDRAEFFDLAAAKQRINPAQIALLDALAESRASKAL